MIQMFPNLTAEGTILPGRYVTSGVAPFTGVAVTAVTDVIIGVSGLDTRSATSTGSPAFTQDDLNHAIATEQIRNQEGHVHLIEAGAAMATVGVAVGPDSVGRVIAAVVTAYAAGVNLDTAGAAGEFVKVFWSPTGIQT